MFYISTTDYREHHTDHYCIDGLTLLIKYGAICNTQVNTIQDTLGNYPWHEKINVCFKELGVNVELKFNDCEHISNLSEIRPKVLEHVKYYAELLRMQPDDFLEVTLIIGEIG